MLKGASLLGRLRPDPDASRQPQRPRPIARREAAQGERSCSAPTGTPTGSARPTPPATRSATAPWMMRSGVAGVFEIARAFAAGASARAHPRLRASGPPRSAGCSAPNTTPPIRSSRWRRRSRTSPWTCCRPPGPCRDVVLVGARPERAGGGARRGRRATGPHRHARRPSRARPVLPRRPLQRGQARRAGVAADGASAAGHDLVNGRPRGGRRWVTEYTAHCYHQPCDDWRADWDLRAPPQDVQLLSSSAASWPPPTAGRTGSHGSEFKAVRDRSAAARK